MNASDSNNLRQILWELLQEGTYTVVMDQKGGYRLCVSGVPSKRKRNLSEVGRDVARLVMDAIPEDLHDRVVCDLEEIRGIGGGRIGLVAQVTIRTLLHKTALHEAYQLAKTLPLMVNDSTDAGTCLLWLFKDMVLGPSVGLRQ
jgi:hypothetical protein